MKKIFISLGIFSILIIGVLGIYFKHSQSQKSHLVVSPIDEKGIFVGGKKLQYRESDPNKLSPETRKRVEDYDRDVQGIDKAWVDIGAGDNYFKSEKYEAALQEYQEAYKKDLGSRTFVGVSRLIPTYEKLKHYDEALALLDEMEKFSFKGDYGHQKAEEIRARLLAAKNQSNQSQN